MTVADRQIAASNSIAVIPFINLSPNESDAYFAVGIHEEILNRLTKLGSLHVVATDDRAALRGDRQDDSEIARELNVETVMEGSVRYADGRVLVSTQLIDGAPDSHLWSETYEREFSNIFAIQSEIALSVAQAMQAELLPAERASVERAPTTLLAAYEVYLSAVARDIGQSEDAIQKGLEEVDRAIALDPRFAMAFALKASLSAVAPFFDAGTYCGAPRRWRAGGAARARSSSPTSVRRTRHSVSCCFRRKTGLAAKRRFATASKLNVPLGDMPSYAVLQLSVGRFGYAREILREARETVPQNPTALSFLMVANALLGDWAAAATQYELGARLFDSWALGSEFMMHLLVARGELAAARAVPPATTVDAAMIRYLDRPADGLPELRAMNADTAFADPISKRAIATWAASFGDPALALEAIRSAATRQGGNALFVWLPQFREARQRPEFRALLRELGIVAYWQEFGWQSVCRPLAAGDFACD